MADTIVRLVMTTQGVKEGAREFQNFEKTSTRAMSSAEASVASSLGKIAAQYLSLGIAINKGMKAMSQGVEFNKFVETQTMAFTVMMKSAEKAKAQMKDLYDFAVSSPLTFKETAGSAKQLMAYGFTAKELIPTMERLGTVALATGHDLGDIAYVYGTLKSQGRAYSRDLMQFGMRGIPIYEELASVMGVTADKIQKMASEGKIGFKEVEQAFMNMTSGSGRFAGTIDGYMETLTGKMSMLGDITERTLGSLMDDTTNVMKRTVDNLTEILSSAGFQKTIESIGKDIGNIVSSMSVILAIVIKLAPLIISVLKLWITAKVIQGISKLPNMLQLVSEKLLDMAVSVSTMNIAFTSGNITRYFSAAIDGAKLLGAELRALVIANPWLLAITAVAGGGMFLASKYKQEQEKQKDDSYAYGKIENTYRAGIRNGDIKSYQDQVEFVKMAANAYDRSAFDVAKMLYDQKLISREVAEQAGYAFAIEKANMRELAARTKGLSENHSSMKIQQEFLNSLTGLGEDRYADSDGIAKGRRGAEDFLKGFSDKMATEKAALQDMYTPEMEKSALQDEASAITDALIAGFKVEKLFDKTGFDETLMQRLRVLQEKLKGMGASVNDLKPPADMGTWWEPIIQAAKMTETAVDDIGVSYAKHIEDVNKEAEARKENLVLQMQATEDVTVQASLQSRILGIELLRKQTNEDLTEEMKKQIELAKIQEGAAKFDKMIGGDSEYFDKLKADIFASREAGKNGGATFSGTMGMLGDTAKLATQGTEVGAMLSGGDPVMMLIMSLAEAAASIENINKLLNPIGTVLDAMFAVLEPFVNSALQPTVSWLEMFGEVVGKIIAPFMSIIQIINATMYQALLPLQVVLQLVGAAFVWLNDSVIAPWGNKFIDMVNSLIRMLNKIPGVHIRYLDNINLLSKATASLADRMNLAKDSLSASIDYLSNKINKVADKELDKLQELYEVGAISGAEYEQMQKNITRVNTDNLNVPDEYKNLTSVDSMMYALTKLAEGQFAISQLGDEATPEAVKAILDELGIYYNEKTQEELFYNAMLSAMKDYQVAQIKYQSEEGAKQAAEADAKLAEDPAYQRWKAQWAPDNPVDKYINEKLDDFVEWSGENLYNAGKFVEKKFNEATKGFVHPFSWLTGRAVGTPELPRDMPIFAHKGEGIIPATFMDSIRSGELTLSGGKNQGTGQVVYVTVNVQGSVTTEEELSDAVARNIYQRRSTGVLTY